MIASIVADAEANRGSAAGPRGLRYKRVRLTCHAKRGDARCREVDELARLTVDAHQLVKFSLMLVHNPMIDEHEVHRLQATLFNSPFGPLEAETRIRVP
jgi:hypothetical protein